MKPFLRLIASLLFFSSLSFSQSAYLMVQHPQQTWRSGTGTIEQAALVVRPTGILMQHDLYLTFSGRGLGFSASDSVEITLNFDMPKDALITDLWLWVGSDTSRAYILDRWTASSIYESIVRRRRDPALLTKNSSTSYTLRIYPLEGTGTRKIKMSYMMPTDWSARSVAAQVPTWILRKSRYSLSSVPVFYRPTAIWNTPQISEYPNLTFTAVSDSTYGEGLRCNLPSSALQSTVNLSLNSPLKNGVYVAKYSVGTDGVYQMAVLPSKALELQTAKKVLFLLDYDGIKTNLTKDDILSNIKLHLKQYYTASDSFNVFFAGDIIRRASEQWQQADSGGVAQLFASVGSNPITDATNVPQLLTSGVEFVKQHGGEGQLVLVASSDRLGDYRIANPIITELQQMVTPKISIHVVDLITKNYNYYYINGKYYYGNDYFYDNIARMTNGTYQTLRTGGTMSAFLVSATQTLRGLIESFDLYTKLENGFSYGRFTSGTNSLQSTAPEKVIFQVGKFKGTFPFVTELAGMYDGEVVQRRVTLQDSDIETMDSTTATIWTGYYIAALEGQVASNSINKQIVDASVQQRVLARLTAFLALEPNDTLRICATCSTGTGGGVIGGTEKDDPTIPKEPFVRAYPNPFNATTNVEVRLPNGALGGEVTMKIYNMLGQTVKAFDVSQLSETNYHKIIWDGRNDGNAPVASGVYYFVLTTTKGRYTVKLVMVK